MPGLFGGIGGGRLMKASNRQVGGNHYRGRGGIQHWDFAASRHHDYFQGAIGKYLDRWKEKNGLEDLLKAQHYLEKYIEEVKAGRYDDELPERLRVLASASTGPVQGELRTSTGSCQVASQGHAASVRRHSDLDRDDNDYPDGH